jgi:prepilin-type N-terminal cleavage/methylation domain-containing protein
LLREPSSELLAEVPNVETVRVALLDARPDAWKPAYGKTNGFLPLTELANEWSAVIYLQGELQVNEAGLVAIEIASTEKFDWWLDAEPFAAQKQVQRELPTGKHTVTLRVQVGTTLEPEIKVEFVRPKGSTAQFVAVVDIIRHAKARSTKRPLALAPTPARLNIRLSGGTEYNTARRLRRSAFTLIEPLVVIAIIGLSALLLPGASCP